MNMKKLVVPSLEALNNLPANLLEGLAENAWLLKECQARIAQRDPWRSQNVSRPYQCHPEPQAKDLASRSYAESKGRASFHSWSSEKTNSSSELVRHFPLRVPHHLPQMVIRVLKVARVASPKRLRGGLHYPRARALRPLHNRINLLRCHRILTASAF